MIGRKIKGVMIAATWLVALGQHVHAADDTSLTPQTELVIVVGASGTPEFGEQFSNWVETWRQVSEKAATPMTVIGQSEPGDSSDREQLKSTLDELSVESPTPLWVVLIGHGTFAQNAAKFNLRGPDVSATELAQWLQDSERPVVVVNCASASGAFINRLSGDNRVIVTATKSGVEQNYARFGEFFSRAIASPDSDLDHDDEVSVHEAFLRASAEVRQFYETAGRISTEHALIDDNGDGRGTPATMFRGTRAVGKAKDDAELDGREASRLTLAPADARLPFTKAELGQRQELEVQLEELRQRKSTLDAAAYDAELESLVLQLARLYQAAEQRQQEAP
ncbi:hypothetical protein [Novipirellula aureliae]|nr:hypothetical protein [Novipirellula aureliae]